MHHCDNCDKMIKPKSKNKYLKSNTQKDLEKSIHKTLSKENPDFLNTDNIYNESLTFTIKNIYFLSSEM